MVTHHWPHSYCCQQICTQTPVSSEKQPPQLQDNGAGMPHGDIPDMLGRVLSGTKYGVCQTRGKFGLGAKMALIWSKMTTGMPFEISSAQEGKEFISYYQLDIDIHKNAPNVHAVTVCAHRL
jgi:DNA topoisomerase VI subunit B